METNTENPTVAKQRHGCLTAWLILIIIGSSASSLMYFFARDMVTENLPADTSPIMLILLGILGIGNVIFAVLLFQWKKLGFWGFVLTSIGALIINFYIGLPIGQSAFGLAGIAILYAILQIKKEDVSGWENLE